jgi:hypothetical protein
VEPQEFLGAMASGRAAEESRGLVHGGVGYGRPPGRQGPIGGSGVRAVSCSSMSFMTCLPPYYIVSYALGRWCVWSMAWGLDGSV